MPRDESVISVDIDSKSDRSDLQVDQLAKARHVALQNRRSKLKAKLEAKLSTLRAALGDLPNDQLKRVGELLVETEDRHRTKYTAMIGEMMTAVNKIHAEVKTLRSLLEKQPAKHATLSDVSSVGIARR